MEHFPNRGVPRRTASPLFAEDESPNFPVICRWHLSSFLQQDLRFPSLNLEDKLSRDVLTLALTQTFVTHCTR